MDLHEAYENLKKALDHKIESAEKMSENPAVADMFMTRANTFDEAKMIMEYYLEEVIKK